MVKRHKTIVGGKEGKLKHLNSNTGNVWGKKVPYKKGAPRWRTRTSHEEGKEEIHLLPFKFARSKRGDRSLSSIERGGKGSLKKALAWLKGKLALSFLGRAKKIFAVISSESQLSKIAPSEGKGGTFGSQENNGRRELWIGATAEKVIAEVAQLPKRVGGRPSC